MMAVKKKVARKNDKKEKGGKNYGLKLNSENRPTVVTKDSLTGNRLGTRNRLPRACKNSDKDKVDAPSELDVHFRADGLVVRPIAGDGNCLFRALSDQMEGNQNNHRYYRLKIVEHIRANIHVYATYHEREEEEKFETRLKNLAKNASHGGHECIVAFARMFNRMVFVHQPLDQAIIEAPPWPSSDAEELHQVHVIFTNRNHYQSVRLLSGDVPGPARVHRVVIGGYGIPQYIRNGEGFIGSDGVPDTEEGVRREIVATDAHDVVLNDTVWVEDDSGLDVKSSNGSSRETSLSSCNTDSSQSAQPGPVSDILKEHKLQSNQQNPSSSEKMVKSVVGDGEEAELATSSDLVKRTISVQFPGSCAAPLETSGSEAILSDLTEQLLSTKAYCRKFRKAMMAQRRLMQRKKMRMESETIKPEVIFEGMDPVLETTESMEHLRL